MDDVPAAGLADVRVEDVGLDGIDVVDPCRPDRIAAQVALVLVRHAITGVVAAPPDVRVGTDVKAAAETREIGVEASDYLRQPTVTIYDSVATWSAGQGGRP